jgi:hypothetical protein
MIQANELSGPRFDSVSHEPWRTCDAAYRALGVAAIAAPTKTKLRLAGMTDPIADDWTPGSSSLPVQGCPYAVLKATKMQKGWPERSANTKSGSSGSSVRSSRTSAPRDSAISRCR